jgi:LacI family transcriptional regulator
VLHAAHDRGARVGCDLAISGFDGIEDTEHTQPALTTLVHPVYDIARRLVRMLLQQLSGEQPEERRMRVALELVIRESTRC